MVLVKANKLLYPVCFRVSMCGIIAYKGDKKASEILLRGIKNLEYRGYDSVGIITKSNNSLFLNNIFLQYLVYFQISFPFQMG